MNGDFSDDTIAGLIIAGLMLIQEIQDENAIGLYFLLSQNNLIFEIKDPIDFESDLIQEYAQEKDTIIFIYPNKKYGIWIARYGDSDYYDLVTFNNANEFMQGFITMCNYFQVDFRKYILGPPFDSKGIEYNIIV